MKLKLYNHETTATNIMPINDFINWFNEFDTTYTLELVETKKPKANSLPDNWQGNGRFRLLDKTTNTHFETDFEKAWNRGGIKMKINDKLMNLTSIAIAGIDMNDYPDFADAYVESATYLDGSALSDDEMDALQDEYPAEIHSIILDSIYY
jgi:hypothetical protein